MTKLEFCKVSPLGIDYVKVFPTWYLIAGPIEVQKYKEQWVLHTMITNSKITLKSTPK